MIRQKKAVVYCLLLLSFVSCIRYINNSNYWLVDILSHFAVQYALLAVLFLAACVGGKMHTLALWAGILVVLNINAIIDTGNPAQAAENNVDTFKVYSANISKNNTGLSQVVNSLNESDADIILLLEVTSENIIPLQSIIEKYPYHIVNLNDQYSGTGTVLMSKFPILNQEVTKYSNFGNMLITATLDIADKQVLFYGAHFPRPIFFRQFPDRTKQIILLARQIKEQSLPVILAGDFNATPFSPVFMQLMKESGLKDSREGFGWQPSWPAHFPFFWIPIDHMLVSPKIQVLKRATGPFIGSDHYPVIAELSISL